LLVSVTSFSISFPICLDRYANNQHTWFLVKEQLQTHAQLLIRIRYEKSHMNASRCYSGC